MKNNWVQAIEAFEPRYNDLKRAMENGTKIKPSLYQGSNRKWKVTLDEIWDDDVIYADAKELDDTYNWAANELLKWKGVSRTAWNIWEFASKRDAERFIIIYNLTWLS